ncbi:Por secretion system C-terminal sorting domain-containing protein [Chryseobacterium arachidis]|uniref:Por secretion system C-terminal sorting domain-containing protein n=1 Tax=Chryseobacterium arachidis TaxID=1416778 RepID=A0A1M5CZV1_9FLAO|nr:endonuclease [Chryseobacterium arachidis]SHF60042.1 Por secretion system C-terminal sorting domain-containing protein [Chryseobacterium arachidis]
MKRTLFPFLLLFAFFNAFAQAPAGYYNAAAGLTGFNLKTALNQIITTGHTPGLSYNNLWTAYQTTDRDYDYENDGSILDIYSENPIGADPYNFTYGTNQCGSSYSQEGDCYNREHIVPQSLFNQGLPMRGDAHFVRATDGKVNNERGSLPYGKVGSANYTSLNGSKRGTSASPGFTGTVFEPIDAFKGDVARMIFYFVTRYETQLETFTSANGTGNMLGTSAFPGLQNWELDQLLIWHLQDPVSPAEVRRNNATYTYQGNRNPYIDHPEYVNQIWGTPVIDTQAPTAPTNLVANNPTSNSIAVSWTAATDNIGVTAYEVYANGILKATVTGTSTTVNGLSPLTTYTFYVIAKDAAGNPSPQSNNAVETTLDGPVGGSCGAEDFSTIPTSPTTPAYDTRTWTNNSITWTATDARIDQTINGKAINIRNGSLTSSTISGGIGSLTVTTKLPFSDTAGNLTLQINGNNVGTIPFNTTNITTTISNLNISGNIVISLLSPLGGKRISIDDLSWTCYAGALATTETSKEKTGFTVYPNPVKNNELFVKGENLSKISKAQIYDFSGKLIETIENPFKNSNKINLKGLVKGNYILKTDAFSTKFIVD